MYILGISGYDEHTSTVSLIKDGILFCSISEERLSRIKYDNSFPSRSIIFCLEKAGIELTDISYITYFKNPWLKIKYAPHYIIKNFPQSITSIQFKRISILKNITSIKSQIKKLFPNLRIPPIKYIDHHLCHAAAVFYHSPFKESSLLSVDFAGEATSFWLGYVKDHSITCVKEIFFPDSLGFIYAAFTEYMGFKMLSDEGKVMGLSSYGNNTYTDIMREFYSYDNIFTLHTDLFNLSYEKEDVLRKNLDMFSEKAKRMLPQIKGTTKEPCNIMKDIARSLQTISEEILIYIATLLYQETQCKNLCYSGGFALNSVANGKLYKKKIFDNVFVFPAADDAGASAGSALYYYYHGAQK